jgi:hypothetical protein
MKQLKNRFLMAKLFLAAILIFGLIVVPGFLQAKELGERDVSAAVQTWVRYVTADAREDAVVEKLEPYVADGVVVTYIAHLADSGFCLCGADDMLLPVYLYSPEGRYDPENPAYRYFLDYLTAVSQWLKKAQETNEAALEEYRPVFEDRRKYWADLGAGSVPQKVRGTFDGPAAVTLDLTSVWHQWSPYNDLCPELTPGMDEHAVIGCVAGSVAAIMRYWQWPATGVGSEVTSYNYRFRTSWDEEPLAINPNIPSNWAGGGRLEWTATSGGKLRMNGYWDGTVYEGARNIDTDASYRSALQNLYDRLTPASKNCSANFGTTAYQWHLMENIHTEPPEAKDTAVATLCYHAGVACEMDYGVWGSGAWPDSAVSAFKYNFRYDDDVEYVVRDTGHYASGVNDMIDEIQWLRPVNYTGWEMVHSWIIFAYNRTFLPDSIQFGMNSVNGSIDWISWENTYPYPNHCFIRYIAPENVVKFAGAVDPGDGSPNDPYQNIQEAIVEAPEGATLIFKAGSVNTFSGSSILIDKPLTLRGKGVLIKKE